MECQHPSCERLLLLCRNSRTESCLFKKIYNIYPILVSFFVYRAFQKNFNFRLAFCEKHDIIESGVSILASGRRNRTRFLQKSVTYFPGNIHVVLTESLYTDSYTKNKRSVEYEKSNHANHTRHTACSIGHMHWIWSDAGRNGNGSFQSH